MKNFDVSRRSFVKLSGALAGSAMLVGCGGSGGSAELRALCEPLGIRVTVVPPLMEQDRPISSTRIRQLVADGAMEQAAQLLGRPYAIDFAVVHGRALGRTLGLPTINQPFPENFVLPRFGVYASAVQLDGRLYHAVTNVGVKPTVGASGPLAETYIVGYSGDLYDQHVTVQLRAFLRPEEKFPSIEALKQQIERDCTAAQQILHAKNME
jgi:riboflavin kinase/FMN adenylyltransferase